MDRKTKGRLAEAKALVHFIQEGYEVYTPFVDNTKYDMLLHKDGELLRVSVKYCNATLRSGTWTVNMKQSSRRANNNIDVKKFDASEYDLIAVYIHPEDRVHVCPSTDATTTQLNIKPTEDCQSQA